MIAACCSLLIIAARIGKMARIPARPGSPNMKKAVTHLTPEFCTAQGAIAGYGW